MPKGTVILGVECGWSPMATPVPPAAAFVGVWPVFVTQSADATNRYIGLGWQSPMTATDAEAASRMPGGLSVTSWTVQLGTALGAGETLVARFVVNGTPDASLTIAMSEGDDGGRSADGSLAFAADDIVAIEFVVGGSLASVTVLGCLMAYESDDGQFAFSVDNVTASPWTMAFANTQSAPQSNDFTGATTTFRVPSYFNPLTSNLTFSALSVQMDAPITKTFQPQLNDTAEGASLALLNQEGATGAISVACVRPANGAALPTNNFTIEATGSILVTPCRYSGLYAVDAPMDAWSVIPAGTTFNGARLGITAGGTLEAHAFGANRSVRDTSLATAEPSVVLRWPNLPGTLQHFMGACITRGVTTPYDIQFFVRVNGVTVIATVAETVVASTPTLAFNDADTAAVVADDLVNFGASTTTTDSFNGGSCPFYAVGFLPD